MICDVIKKNWPYRGPLFLNTLITWPYSALSSAQSSIPSSLCFPFPDRSHWRHWAEIPGQSLELTIRSRKMRGLHRSWHQVGRWRLCLLVSVGWSHWKRRSASRHPVAWCVSFLSSSPVLWCSFPVPDPPSPHRHWPEATLWCLAAILMDFKTKKSLTYYKEEERITRDI